MIDLSLACAADALQRDQYDFATAVSAKVRARRAIWTVTGVVCLAVIAAAMQVAVVDVDSPWLGASAVLALACNAALPHPHGLVDQGICIDCTRCE